MDPVFMKIPIEKLWPNPNQPRQFIRPGAIEAKMASLKAIGQKTIIKVWRLSETEKAAIGGIVEFGVVGGHLRLEAAKKLGWATLDALVYDLTPDQVLLEAFMDNEDEDPHWLDRYRGIEAIHLSQPGLKQPQLADLTGRSQWTVSRALKLTSLLNSQGISTIYSSAIKDENSQEISGISEKAAFALTGLEGAAKTTPEARDLIARALALVWEHRLTEAQVKELVAWVKGGQPLETFDPKAHKAKASGPKPQAEAHALNVPGREHEAPAPKGQAGPQPVPLSPVVTAKGEAPLPSAQPAPPLALSQAAPNPSKSTERSGLAQAAQMVWNGIKALAWHDLKRKAGSRLGVGSGFWGPILKQGLKMAAPLVVALVVYKVAVYVILKGAFPGSRLGFWSSSKERSLQPKPGLGTPVQPNEAPVQPQAIQSAPVIAAKPVAIPTAVPILLTTQVRVAQESDFVGKFVAQAFGANAQDMVGWMDTVKASMVSGAADQFYKDFFPGQKIAEINKKGLALTFQATQPVTCLKTGGDTDEFQAQGVVTTKGGSNNEVIATQPVTLLVDVHHASGAPGAFSVDKVSMAQGKTGDNGTDLVGSALDKGIKALGL